MCKKAVFIIELLQDESTEKFPAIYPDPCDPANLCAAFLSCRQKNKPSPLIFMISSILHAHITSRPNPQALACLQDGLESNIHLSFNADSAGNDNVAVLVSGRPTEEELKRFLNLRALIIPWAGVPPETFELLQARPQVTIHNLHHNAIPVAEYALALMFTTAKTLLPMDRALRQSDWRPRYAPDTALLLSGKTALILGFGHIGRALGKYLKALGMNVLATRYSTKSAIIEEGIEVFPPGALHDLLPRSDFLTIALPLTPKTEGLIGEKELTLLPRHAVVVNIGRGAIINQGALYTALRDHCIAAAGIDVWYHYPSNEQTKSCTPPADFPFNELDNIVMSPHRAGGLNTADTERLRMSHLAVLLNAAARGESIPNHVDREKGY